MFQKWGADLPADETIRTYLKRDKGFNDDVVTSVIKDYKDTLEYAKVGISDKITHADTDKVLAIGGKVQTQQQLQPPPQGEVERVRVSLKGGRLARVVFTGEVPTQADIAKVIASLELQKDSFPED